MSARHSFLGGFLGSLLGPSLAPVVRFLLGRGIALLFVGVLLFATWWQRQPEWVQLLVLCLVIGGLLRWVQVGTGHRRWGRRRPHYAPRVDLENQPHWLYRWYDQDDRLLYVGITNNIERRINEHRDEKHWARQPGVYCVVERDPYPSRSAVLDAEERAIWREGPKHNVVHNW